jgi:hypothetical protein
MSAASEKYLAAAAASMAKCENVKKAKKRKWQQSQRKA